MPGRLRRLFDSLLAAPADGAALRCETGVTRPVRWGSTGARPADDDERFGVPGLAEPLPPIFLTRGMSRLQSTRASTGSQRLKIRRRVQYWH